MCVFSSTEELLEFISNTQAAQNNEARSLAQEGGRRAQNLSALLCATSNAGVSFSVSSHAPMGRLVSLDNHGQKSKLKKE